MSLTSYFVTVLSTVTLFAAYYLYLRYVGAKAEVEYWKESRQFWKDGSDAWKDEHIDQEDEISHWKGQSNTWEEQAKDWKDMYYGISQEETERLSNQLDQSRKACDYLEVRCKAKDEEIAKLRRELANYVYWWERSGSDTFQAEVDALKGLYPCGGVL